MMARRSLLLLLSALLLWSLPATASSVDDELDQLLGAGQDDRGYYQITPFRMRAIGVPSFLWGAFYDEHGKHWSDGSPNFGMGGEFIVREPGRRELVVGFEVSDLRTPDTFWLDSGDPVRRAEWTENNIRLFTLDVRYAGLTDIRHDMHIFYGIGAGLSLVAGQADQFLVDPECIPEDGRRTNRDRDLIRPGGACFNADGSPRLQPDGEVNQVSLPPVLPSLELIAGYRYIIADRLALTVEAGFRTAWFFGGVSLGYTFRM